MLKLFPNTTLAGIGYHDSQINELARRTVENCKGNICRLRIIGQCNRLVNIHHRGSRRAEAENRTHSIRRGVPDRPPASAQETP